LNLAGNTYTSRLGLYVIVVAEQSHKVISTFNITCLAIIFSEEKLFSGVF
jgi:hypothetical protein